METSKKIYKCDLCNTETNNKTQHERTQKHQKNVAKITISNQNPQIIELTAYNAENEKLQTIKISGSKALEIVKNYMN